MSTIPEETYQFKSLVLSDKYLDESSKLSAIIGVDDNGEPILFDFAKNPHLFIGGDQGCGKSTLIHSIIMSLMQRNTPDKFQFVYLDAKGLDVNLYKQSKYLHISKNHHVVDIFEYLLYECNRRLRFLSDNNKKTVASYNESAKFCNDVETFPELFVILDELSYFIDDAKQYIEQLINHGITVGIHFIIADTNPTLGNVLKIAKQIPNKVVFRFTYADYKALLKRNVVPLSEDGEILCDFKGAEYVHGHSCFFSEEEIKNEVAKNIVEIKEVEPPKEVSEVQKKVPILQETKSVQEEKKMPYEALKNKETIDSRDYPEYAQLLKELGIIDVDKVTEPQTVVVSKTEHKAKLLGISEELAEYYDDITLNIQPAPKPKFKDKIKDFLKNHLMLTGTVVLAVIIAAIYFALNVKVDTLALIAVVVLTCVLAAVAIKEIIKWHKYKPETKHNKYSIYAIDNISDGHIFEYVVADLLKDVGFYNVEVTVGSGDFGIDVIGWYEDASYAIQCKKYSGKVGVSAVQEAYSGRSYYGCNYAVVITNNYFTPAAIKLAKSTGVILWDRNNVKKLIKGHI